MDLYTVQMAQWRVAQDRGIPLLDTTVKSGAVQVAPTWEMVLGVKSGSLSEAAYTQQYAQLFEYWYFQDPVFFDRLVRHPVIALGCYCAAGKFCHRHLLVKHLSHITDVNYLGELQK